MQKKLLQKTSNIPEIRAFSKSALCKGYSPCKILALAQKFKLKENMSTFILQIIYSCSVQKTAPKNTKYATNETILKNGHHAKAIAHARSSFWPKNLNSKNHLKIYCTNHLQLFCAENHFKKHQIFQKWEHLEIWPLCKGYRPMQNPRFRSKIKTPKNMSKSILQIIYSCSVQKTVQKTPNIRQMRAFWKIGHHAKAIAHAKSSFWLKN